MRDSAWAFAIGFGASFIAYATDTSYWIVFALLVLGMAAGLMIAYGGR